MIYCRVGDNNCVILYSRKPFLLARGWPERAPYFYFLKKFHKKNMIEYHSRNFRVIRDMETKIVFIDTSISGYDKLLQPARCLLISTQCSAFQNDLRWFSIFGEIIPNLSILSNFLTQHPEPKTEILVILCMVECLSLSIKWWQLLNSQKVYRWTGWPSKWLEMRGNSSGKRYRRSRDLGCFCTVNFWRSFLDQYFAQRGQLFGL